MYLITIADASMKEQTELSKIGSFFLIKIIIGIAVVAGSVALTEWFCRLILDKISIGEDWKNVIVAIADAGIALISYVLLFRTYENRWIDELSASAFVKNAVVGFATGLILQSLCILVIYIAGGHPSFYSFNSYTGRFLTFCRLCVNQEPVVHYISPFCLGLCRARNFWRH
jgi:hypothetical protein